MVQCSHFTFCEPIRDPTFTYYTNITISALWFVTILDVFPSYWEYHHPNWRNYHNYGKSAFSIAILTSPEGKPPFSYGFPMDFLWFSYGVPWVLTSPEGFSCWFLQLFPLWDDPFPFPAIRTGTPGENQESPASPAQQHEDLSTKNWAFERAKISKHWHLQLIDTS